MVYCTGLENRRPRKGSGGSNPSASARGVQLTSSSRIRYDEKQGSSLYVSTTGHRDAKHVSVNFKTEVIRVQ